MTVARTLAAIRRALLEDPDVDIRFVDAITVDSHLLSTHGQALILFVHPHATMQTQRTRRTVLSEP